MCKAALAGLDIKSIEARVPHEGYDVYASLNEDQQVFNSLLGGLSQRILEVGLEVLEAAYLRDFWSLQIVSDQEVI